MPRASQTSLKSSPGREVIDIIDTPPKAQASDATAGPSRGNVASIFASRKRVKLEDKTELESEAIPRPNINERKRPSMNGQRAGKDEIMEKKPRINPLTANQP